MASILSMAIWLIFTSVLGALADDSRNYFINPASSNSYAGDSTYESGQALDITWVTNLTSYDLVLWQVDGDQSSYHIFQQKTSGSGYLWTIDVSSFDTGASDQFFLSMYKTGATEPTFSTQNFFVEDDGEGDDGDGASYSGSSSSGFGFGYASATSLYLSEPTTTYVSVTQTQFATATATSRSGSGSSSSSNLYGDSSFATYNHNLSLGLGLGLGLGIPLLAAIVGIAYLLGRTRGNRDDAASAVPETAMTEGPAGPNRASAAGAPGAASASQPAVVEHYGPSSWNDGGQGPSQEPLPSAPVPAKTQGETGQMQPIVAAKYQ